jgi:very-short-patch-repair endonuclease
MRDPHDPFSPTLVTLDAICELSRRGAGPDWVGSRIAERQLNLITTRQLCAAGLNKPSIDVRCSRGTLHRVHRGVYMWGAPVWLTHAREFAAVLAFGDEAVIGYRSGIGLWGIGDADDSLIHIILVGKGRRSRPGIRVHRVADLPADERTHRNGVPITSPARTLLDFASQARPDELEQAIAEAYVQRLTTEKQLRTILARHPHRSGAATLRSELEREGGPAWTRSKAERLMKKLLRQARLPAALTNQMVAGHQADFAWLEQRLIVEVDGYRYHGNRAAFERDRKRDAAHTLAGYRVIRITWRQLTEEPIAVAVIIARALAM